MVRKYFYTYDLYFYDSLQISIEIFIDIFGFFWIFKELFLII